MIPIKPDPKKFLLAPCKTREVVYAEHQEPYIPLPAIRHTDGRVASCWMPDKNEMALLNSGVPITLVLHTFNEPLQPIQIMVGGADLR